MDDVIVLADDSDNTVSFHHDLSDRDECVAEGFEEYDGQRSEDEHGSAEARHAYNSGNTNDISDDQGSEGPRPSRSAGFRANA